MIVLTQSSTTKSKILKTHGGGGERLKNCRYHSNVPF